MHSEQAAPDLLQKSLDASGVGWWQLDFGQREMTCSRLAADLFGDRDAAQFERGFLAQMKCEQEYSGDGGFYTKRLDNIRRHQQVNADFYCVLPCLSFSLQADGFILRQRIT